MFDYTKYIYIHSHLVILHISGILLYPMNFGENCDEKSILKWPRTEHRASIVFQVTYSLQNQVDRRQKTDTRSVLLQYKMQVSKI